MFNLRERLLTEYVPWTDYFADDVVGDRHGGVLMILGIDGLPFETIDDGVINHRHARLEFALRDVALDGITFHYLQCRGVADASVYPVGAFRSAFAEQLDRRYREVLFGRRAMWLNQSFLAMHLAPRQVGPKAVSGIARLFGDRPGEAPQDRIDELRRAVGQLVTELKDYRPRVLRVVQRGRALFSEIAEAVAFAMTGYWRPVPMTTGGAASVFNEAFIVGRETFEVRMPHASAWGACLDMAEFPFLTSPGMFDQLLSSNYRHTVMHAWRFLPATDGLALATRQQNKMRVGGDRATDQVIELSAAANLIASNRLAMGEYAHALTVFTDDRGALGHVIEQALGDLSAGGAKAKRCSWALEGVLFSMIPGNFHLRGRHAAVSSRNFAAFASMHNFPAGERRGFWGDPVLMFRTSGGTPFLYHFQYEGSGNTFISGQTRSGKSTCLGLMIAQAERTGAQILLWDKDRGLEALIRALDGAYLALTVPTGLAPLKRLSSNPEDLTFLSGLLRACIATPEPYTLTPEEDRRLAIALRTVMRLPPAARRLEEVRSFLGTDRTGAGARLEKWCAGAEFGGIIDCNEDCVDLDNPVLGFDQSTLIDNPIAAGAVMATLFHYTGKLVDGRRMLIVLDEVWNALRIPQFQYEIKNGLKTFGKYNSPLLIATQEVSDGLDSAIGDTIRQQCPVQLHFANPGAHWKDYGPGGLNMTETEFDIVKKIAKGTGHFLLRQGVGRSCVLQAPLGGLSEVRVISGTRRGLDALEIARKRTGDATGLVLVEAYHTALAELEEA